jgi:hypothetical protein
VDEASRRMWAVSLGLGDSPRGPVHILPIAQAKTTSTRQHI